MNCSKTLAWISTVVVIVAASVTLSSSVAWSQTCTTKLANGGGGCLSVGATCAATPAPPGPGICTSTTKPDSDRTCRCLDKAGGLILAGDPAATAPATKHPGPGLAGLAILTAMLGLSWLYTRRARRA